MKNKLFKIKKLLLESLFKIKKLLLESRNFLFLWGAQILTQSAVTIVSIIIGILSDEGVLSTSTKGSSFSIGIIVNLSTIPGLFVAPIAGVFADWFSKRKIMIASNIVRFCFLTLFILFVGWQNVWISYVLVLLLSVALQFFIPAQGSLIPSLVKKKHLLFANSLFSLTVYTSLVLGVIFSGLILIAFNIRVAFIICALFLLFSSLLLFMIKTEESAKKNVSILYLIDFLKTLFIDAVSGLKYAINETSLRFAMVHLFLLQVVGFILVTIVFRIGSEIYGVSPRTAGPIIFAPLIAGLFIGFLLINTIGRSSRRIMLIWIGSIFSVMGFGLMSVIAQLQRLVQHLILNRVAATISLLFVGLSVPFLLIPAQTLISENTREEFRGRVLGIWLALTSSLASLVALIFGFVTDAAGDISLAITLLVFANIVYAIFLYILSKRYNDI